MYLHEWRKEEPDKEVMLLYEMHRLNAVAVNAGLKAGYKTTRDFLVLLEEAFEHERRRLKNSDVTYENFFGTVKEKKPSEEG